VCEGQTLPYGASDQFIMWNKYPAYGYILPEVDLKTCLKLFAY